MALVTALSGKMQHIGRVSHWAFQPVGNVFPKAAANLRIETHNIVFSQRFEACIGPIAHWYHDGFLIHLELAGLGEMQTALPGVAEPIGPFPGVTVTFVPDIFFSPQPALLA